MVLSGAEGGKHGRLGSLKHGRERGDHSYEVAVLSGSCGSGATVRLRQASARGRCVKSVTHPGVAPPKGGLQERFDGL